MIDPIFIIKFLVAVGSVLLISDLFERINPKIAGLLSGYPVGVALALFFFGLENGAEFASQSALFNIVGIVTFLSFIGIYYLATKVFNKHVVAFSTIAATIGFFVIAYFLQQFKFSIAVSLVIAITAILFFMFLFSRIREVQTGVTVKVTFKSIVLKSVVAGSIITGVTSIAGLVGPEWAGLLASFPSTTLPLMLMVHSKYTTLHLNALLKYIPVGSFSIVAYVLAVYYFYPAIGIYWGTLVAYLIATVPIGILYYVQSNEIIKKLRGFFGMADKSTIHFIMTGGTIDYHYDSRMDTVVPNKTSIIPEFISSLEFVNSEFTELFIKDSRSLSNSDYKKH